MIRDPEALAKQRFDVIIIGGGITGACLAHDAALRGLKTALVEKDDFGGFTSAASSKLLHGGIRYLQSAQLHKVRESSRERTFFQIIAPHLTRYVSFIVPTVSGSLMKGKLALIVGMRLYDLLGCGLKHKINDASKKLPEGGFFSKDAIIRCVPDLQAVKGLNGGYIFPESHIISSERMTLAFLKTASANGAQIANYVRVEEFLIQNSQVTGVKVRDKIADAGFNIKGKIVANAAGPHIPELNRKLRHLHLDKAATGFSKGVHLVTRQVNSQYAITLATPKKTEGLLTRGGRHFFIIPWRGRSLIGTTNVPFNQRPDEVTVTRKDIKDFLDDINQALPELHLTSEDIYYAFAGLYPLTAQNIKTDTYQGTGEYQIADHSRSDGLEGIITVLGAKYTTARKVAEKAVDLIVQKTGVSTEKCQTHSKPLADGNIPDLKAFIREKQARYGQYLKPDIIDHLICHYGCGIDDLMEQAIATPVLLERFTPDRENIAAEIFHAVRNEMALTLEDVVFRRTGLGTIGCPGEKALTTAAWIMADLLDWDAARCELEIEKVNYRYKVLSG
jgi:glycerol-3-phosphate dehydrogenase